MLEDRINKYVIISQTSICNLIYCLNKGLISFRSARIFFALIYLITDKYENFNLITIQEELPVNITEIHNLIGGTGGKFIEDDLVNLKIIGLIKFDTTEKKILINSFPLNNTEKLNNEINTIRANDNKIPIPITLIKYFTQIKKPAVLKVMLAYILCGLFKTDGKIQNEGRVKSITISTIAGVSHNHVKRARKFLVKLNWLSKDTTSSQAELNKFGALFTINFFWEEK